MCEYRGRLDLPSCLRGEYLGTSPMSTSATVSSSPISHHSTVCDDSLSPEDTGWCYRTSASVHIPCDIIVDSWLFQLYTRPTTNSQLSLLDGPVLFQLFSTPAAAFFCLCLKLIILIMSLHGMAPWKPVRTATPPLGSAFHFDLSFIFRVPQAPSHSPKPQFQFQSQSYK